MAEGRANKLEARIEALKEEIASLTKQNAAIPLLQAQLAQLVDVHAASKKERQTIAADLREQLKDLKKEAAEKDAQIQQAQTLSDSQLAKCLELEDVVHQMRLEAEENAVTRQVEIENTRVLVRNLCRLGRRTESPRNSILQETYAYQIGEISAKTSAKEKQETINELVNCIGELETRLECTQTMINQVESEAATARKLQQAERLAWHTDRMAYCERIRAEEAYSRSLVRQLDEYHRHTEVRRNSDRQTTFQSAQIHNLRLETFQADLQHCKSALAEMTESRDAAEFARNGLRTELKQADERIDTLEPDLKATKRSLDALRASADKDQQKRAENIAQISSNLALVTSEKSEIQKQLASVRKQQQDAEQQLTRAKTQESDAKERLAKLQTQLKPYEDLQSAHAILQAKVIELSARNSAAEQDVRDINAVNANLLGHTNPQQKINLLQNLRNELTDMRKKYSVAMAAVDALKAENAEINAEMEALQRGQSSSKGATKMEASINRRRVSVLGTITNI